MRRHIQFGIVPTSRYVIRISLIPYMRPDRLQVRLLDYRHVGVTGSWLKFGREWYLPPWWRNRIRAVA